MHKLMPRNWNWNVRIESQAQLQIMEMEAKYNTTMDGAKIKAAMERDREEMKQNAAMLQAQLAQQNLPNA